MIRKSLITLLALLSLVFVVTGAFADSYQNARQSGTFNIDGKSNVNVAINVSKTATDGYPTNFTGSLYIIGVTGQITSSISCQPLDIQFSTVTINGISYKQSTIISKPFIYIDLRTGRRSQAWTQVTITQYGRGTLNYNVYSLDDNAVVAGSVLASGTIGSITLGTGSTVINP